MAENIAAEVLRPVIEAAVKSVGATIKRQFNYLCCFTSNISTLKDEAQKLDDETEGLQRQVDRERENVQIIVPTVETWLIKSNDIKHIKNTILDEVPNVGSGCFKLRARFSLSKRAKKTADRMEELRGQCKFNAISQPGPPTATQTVPLGMTYEFESRKQIEEDIMTSLRGGDVNMIGICGMGGLGKTTMAKIIMNRALEKHLFEEVVMAVVSQPVDKLKIQEDIGGPLGLKLEEETSMANRVQKLHARLKRIILVLDDVWERLELEELGLPRGCKDCTILLTSRNDDVLRAMNVEKVFGMKVLPKEDAWFLFREIAGTCVDDTGLHSIAQQVVEECGGLPIALTTVGAALKDEKNVSIWNDALRQLRKCDPDIPQLIAKVYNPLKLSYDVLGSKHAKFVFLLCCLFGEDADISLECLAYFCMGLGIFDGDMEEARNRMWALIKMLKSRSLLLDGHYENHVRMHDVVRDVCIFIAKEEGYIGGNDCTWFSSFQTTVKERNKLPANLRLLYLTDKSKMEKEIKFDSSFVEGIRDLQVWCIERYKSLTSLPHTAESLRNLNSLMLYSCRRLETLSAVGELVNLEILVCHQCNSIKELPPEIKGLNRLKLLELMRCRRLERIGGGIISSLVGLEELKMVDSFKKWEACDRKESENANARLRELESLINLKCLEIEIENPALATENMHLSSNLERFQIRIPSMHMPHNFSSYRSYKKLSLKWEGRTCIGDWIEKQLLPDAECLHLRGNGANNVDYLAKSQNIRWLHLEECKTMKNIGRTSTDDATVFPFIEHLNIYSLPKLEEILDGPISSNSFHNLNELRLVYLPALKQLWKNSNSPVFPKLKEVELDELPNLETFELPLEAISSINIRSCPRLRNLGQLLFAGNDCLSQLESLKVEKCEMMEQVFLWNEEDERRIAKIMFPKLKKVELDNLPNLVTLCEGIGGIEFPLLTTMEIIKCPKMIVIGSNENNSGGSSNNDNHSSHLFCQPQKVSLGSLKNIIKDNVNTFHFQKIPVSSFNGLEELTVSGYADRVSLFSFSIAVNLVSLRALSISECDEMVRVMQDEEEKAVIGGGRRTLLLPNLQELTLLDLPKLESFCECNCDVELPSLKKVLITGCPNLKSFTLSAPNFESFTTDLPNYLEDGVLNVSFDSLKILAIEGNIENPLYSYKIHASLFNGLKELTICGYEGSVSLFTSSITRNFVSLRELSISECHEMTEVIKDEEDEEDEEVLSLFPNLQNLYLYDLPKLVSFCEWNCDVNCRTVDIRGCSNMKIFNLGSNVSFSFNGLEELTILRYKGSMSLFSPSIAGNLVNLKQLEISYCNKMVKVIEDEKEEENVVSGGGAQTTTTILFPKLQELMLQHLHKLESFCEWKCGVELPSLREVEIIWCSNLKTFSLGPLTTPNLIKVKINDEYFGGGNDLNGALKQQYLEQKEEAANRQKQRKTTTKEEEGAKGEIEE
ncbi:hypothetical protein C2S53_015305, partial [Perilla frutescens var. hirtella]